MPLKKGMMLGCFQNVGKEIQVVYQLGEEWLGGNRKVFVFSGLRANLGVK